ncbi:MAG: polyprenyl diphosphate synthase [Chloroflexota bacterium]|nr:polyprenyl diphosphate synthase [Chloroflexota bacterium]
MAEKVEINPTQREVLRLLGVPTHIGIIMDGNGRWADRRGLPKTEGHRAGVQNVRRVVRACVEFGVQMLTLYAFSTENWGRSPSEIRGLMELAEEYSSEVEELHRQGVRIRHLGSLEEIASQLGRLGMRMLGQRIPQRIEEVVDLTKDNTHFTLNLAFNYGGRREIVRAARRIIEEGIAPERLRGEEGEKLFEGYLWSAGLPDPDLIIRTAGEMRLSNFLLWQAAYSEFWATPVLWPDFDADELYQALIAYSMRERRYGRRPSESDT